MGGQVINGQDGEIPATTRYAAAIILNKLLQDKEIEGVAEALIKEGALTYI